MPGADVIDPAAAHSGAQPVAEDWRDTEPIEPEVEHEPEPPEDDALPPVDNGGEPTFKCELEFESTGAITDAQTVWRRAGELIESARAKGLELVGGQVYPGEENAADAAVMEQALRELAELDAQRQEAS